MRPAPAGSSGASDDRPGVPPLGLHWDGSGCSAAVWAPAASAVEVCLFDAAPEHQVTEQRVALPACTSGVWHGHVPGIGPGQRYGLRVDGAYDPARGLRHNPAKLLLDPYARRVQGEVRRHRSLLGYSDVPRGARRDETNSAPFVPRGVIAGGEAFDWRDDAPPRTPWADTVVYEAHVKGLTALHPGVPPHLRGTFAGLATDAVIEHLTQLGVTAVELLPVQASATELSLQARGLRNYWGYSTLGFFAPHPAYAATGDPVPEFQAMVRALHAAGLEVLLDVVYNHTAEGDERGPTLSLRGLDNTGYYRLRDGDPSRYVDSTGCGNTVDLASPPALALVLDSLRYWVGQMHVDGFRFDLASTLFRDTTFAAAVAADPVLSGIKLVAEPWDMQSYDVGSFPAPWTEWNGRYRDAIRDTWRGRVRGVGELATKISGSADLYAGRSPQASINFVTAHDGFTLADLVSYERKHNDANGEHGRDGSEDNRSGNSGVEGPTQDPAVLDERRRTRRALVATLLLSQGVPMLLAGDELGHTQFGNNNAYCQDNVLSWLPWPARNGADSGDGANPAAPDPAGPDPLLLPLVRGLVALRRRTAVLRRSTFFRGGPPSPGELADVCWFGADGRELSGSAWDEAVTLQVFLSGAATGTESLLLVLSPAASDVVVTLPAAPLAEQGYRLLLDTGAPDLAGFAGDAAATASLLPGAVLQVRGRSVLVLTLGVAAAPGGLTTS